MNKSIIKCFDRQDTKARFSAIPLISHRDLLDLSRVGDDLLHDLHGLTLGLGRLSLTLRRRGLDDLHLLALAHLHGHRRALSQGEEEEESKEGERPPAS